MFVFVSHALVLYTNCEFKQIMLNTVDWHEVYSVSIPYNNNYRLQQQHFTTLVVSITNWRRHKMPYDVHNSLEILPLWLFILYHRQRKKGVFQTEKQRNKRKINIEPCIFYWNERFNVHSK